MSGIAGSMLSSSQVLTQACPKHSATGRVEGGSFGSTLWISSTSYRSCLPLNFGLCSCIANQSALAPSANFTGGYMIPAESPVSSTTSRTAVYRLSGSVRSRQPPIAPRWPGMQGIRMERSWTRTLRPSSSLSSSITTCALAWRGGLISAAGAGSPMSAKRPRRRDAPAAWADPRGASPQARRRAVPRALTQLPSSETSTRSEDRRAPAANSTVALSCCMRGNSTTASRGIQPLGSIRERR
mmetsp:Transcript_65837/g.203817  ORF Transcript_65837/g.203817 Transcript_65837/m.203817 type:complete len:241 (-) Transcript_65837:59-781(-)